jgi:putative FmdB family regulatory protein
MPLYTYRCGTCGQSHEQHNTITNRANGPECCGAQAVKQIDAVRGFVSGGIDIDYRCTVTGEPVQTMRKRQYIMDKHGLVDARDVHGAVHRKLAAEQQEMAAAKAEQAAIPDAVKQAALATVPPVGA